jgi:hypothetical protein
VVVAQGGNAAVALSRAEKSLGPFELTAAMWLEQVDRLA